jgi:hypothetical protein
MPYGPRCAVCDVAEPGLLDAAHLRPKGEDGSDHPGNGLVLRPTHHRVFDGGLFAVEPGTLRLDFKANGPDAERLGVRRPTFQHLSRKPHPEALRWQWDNWVCGQDGRDLSRSASPPLEDLAAVPVDVPRLRPPVRPLRLPGRPAVEGHQGLLEARRAARPVRDDQDAVGDGERPQIERLVMQHAQRQPVALGVGAARLVPPDVRGVEGNRDRPEPDVDPTHGTLVLVRRQHPLPERRVAPPLGGGRFERQADGVEDVLLEGLGEVPPRTRPATVTTRVGSAVRAARTSGENPARTSEDRRAATRGISSPVFNGRFAGAWTVQTPSRWSRQNRCSGWSDRRGGPNSRSRAVRSGSTWRNDTSFWLACHLPRA